jgi:hypothetical protein
MEDMRNGIFKDWWKFDLFLKNISKKNKIDNINKLFSLLYIKIIK